MKTAAYNEIMKLMDERDNMTLYLLQNDIFVEPTAVLVYNEDEDDEQVYVLTDMQSAYYPTSIDEVAEYDWVRAEDVDW